MSERNATQRPRRRRPLLWIGGGLLVLLIGGLAAGWAFRRPLAERIVIAALERQGIDAVALHVEDLGFGKVVVGAVALGTTGTLRIGRIEAVPDFTHLTAPRLASLRLVGVQASAAIGPDGSLDLGPLNAFLTPAQPGAVSAPPPLDQVKVERLQLDLATPYGPLVLGLDGSADLAQATGQASFVVSGAGEQASGNFSVARQDDGIGLSANLASGSDTLTLDGVLDPAGLLPRVGTARLAVSDIARLARFLPGLAGLSGAAQLDLEREASGALAAKVRLSGLNVPDLVQGLDASLSLAGDPSALENGVLPLSGTGSAAKVTLAGAVADQARLDLMGSIALDPAVLAVLRGGDGTAAEPFRGADLVLKLDAARLASGALRGRSAALVLDIGIAGAWPAADIAVRGGQLGFAALELGTQVKATKPVRFDLKPATTAPLRGPTDALAIGFTLAPADLSLLASGRAVRLKLPALAASATFGEALGLHVEGCCGSASLAEPKLEATGLRLTLASAQGKLLTARFVLDRVATPWTVPLAADGNFNLEGDALRFDGSVKPQGQALASVPALALSGTHDLASGAGGAEADLPRLTFVPDGLQPGQLAPPLIPLVSAVGGTVAAHGSLAWTARGLTSGGRLLVEDLSLTASGVPAAHINTVVELDSLLPPTTPAGQRLAIGAITMGVPLTDGIVTFRLRPDAVEVAGASLALAGGKVSLAATRIELPVARESLALTVDGVTLGSLLQIAGVDGLSAEGMLDGTIPVEIAGTTLRIADGRLAARAPGVLRYTPQTYPAALQGDDSRIQLLVQALRDFRYDRLGLSVNREANGEAVLGLSLAGRNPAVLDGYPFELNLNLSGRLDQIVSEGLAGYRIPDDIRRRMQQFGN